MMPWDNQCHVFLGDVTEAVAATVAFPTNAFTSIVNTLACTMRYIQAKANLQTLFGLDTFPTLTIANAIATLVTTRFIMYLPSCYAPLFLDAVGHTAKQVWQTFMPILLQNQDAVDCQGLVKWLQVAAQETSCNAYLPYIGSDRPWHPQLSVTAEHPK